MKLFFILTLILMAHTPAYADIKKVVIKDLNLDYVVPYGKGNIEKIDIATSLVQVPMDIELHRLSDAFVVNSPYVNFTWHNPIKTIYSLEELSAKNLSISVGGEGHDITGEVLKIKPTKDSEEFKAEMIKLKCLGTSTARIEQRILQDCRMSMDLTIKKLELPGKLALENYFPEISDVEVQDDLIPTNNLSLKIVEGNFNFETYVKYWFYAGVRGNGYIQFENDNKVIAIRVDQVKFGYLPVTALVMKKLKELIRSPKVEINPPWIRIQVGK